MADREKVINELRFQLYSKEVTDEHYPVQLSALDATAILIMLKEHEPRVLTLEEATGDDECWFEFRPSNIGRYADCYLHDNPDRTRVYFTGKAVMSLFDNADYNKTWRCWTAKPTDEQREAVKWDG